jgi:hypothetical protein
VIALLTVLAVALPATAQGLPLVGTPDLPVPGPVDDVTAATSCRAVHIDSEPSNGQMPDLSVRVDPDGCVRRLIDDVWPFYGLMVWFDSEGDGFSLL